MDADPNRLENISSMLAEANHSVLPVSSADEAEEALLIAKIDVVVWGFLPIDAVLSHFVSALREVGKAQKNASRVPVFVTASSSEGSGNTDREIAGLWDGYLPENFSSETLIAACDAATQVMTTGAMDTRSPVEPNLLVFLPEKFREQVAYDPELTVEIIDLFLEEKSVEIPAMHEALGRDEFEILSQIAHTIKGSLSSLHAMQARHNAQELETAAKRRNKELCQDFLGTLTADLEVLEPLLLKLRAEFEAS